MNRSLLVLFIALATTAALFALTRMTVKERTTLTAEEQASQREEAVLVEVLVTGNRTAELAIAPKDPATPAELSTFALHILLAQSSGSPVLATNTLTVNPDLIDDGWTFPIASVSESEPGKVEMKLSGALLSQIPLTLSSRVVLASFTLDPSVSVEGLTATLGMENTKFLKPDTSKRTTTPLSVQQDVVVTSE